MTWFSHQEYEEKLLDLKNQFEQEQMSNAKLQKDMDKLKSQYEQQVIQSRPGICWTLNKTAYFCGMALVAFCKGVEGFKDII